MLIRNNANIAHYTGVTTCGSIWACPCCQGKILNHRAEEISTGAANWDRAGNTVYMATFTMPHDVGMRLEPLFDTVANGFRAVISGRAWAGESKSAYAKRLDRWETKHGVMEHPAKPRPVRHIGIRERIGVVGQIRSMEITYGDNGFHPHLHVLFFIEGQLDAQGLADFILHLREKWQTFVVKAGYRTPSDERGVDVQRCRSAAEAGAYIAKTEKDQGVGNEMARGDLKQGRNEGRTPVEVLDEFRWTGDAAFLRVWHEYERVTKSRQRITWSKGLRKLLLGDEEEKSNEDIAAEEVGGEDVALIPNQTWRAIVRRPGLSGALLDAAEQTGLQGVNGLLQAHHLPAVAPPPELVQRRSDV